MGLKAIAIKRLFLALLPLFPLNAGIEHYFKKIEDKGKENSIEGIDFIYLINLDKRKEKYESSLRQLLPFGIIPYRFSAVDGLNLSDEALLNLGVQSSEMKNPTLMATAVRLIEGKLVWKEEMASDPQATYYSRFITKERIGCVLSHLSVLQDAYDAHYETVWVMEDDIEVIQDPRLLSEYLKKLDATVPNWDLFFTDSDTKNEKGERIPCTATAPRPNLIAPPLPLFLKKNYTIDALFSSKGMRYGTYSYIIRRAGMKKLLDFWKTYKIFLAIDIDMCYVPKLKMICPNEEIVSTLPGAISDIH